MFGCIAGYIIEGLFTFLKKGVIINHSAFVIGPFNAIYGICAVIFSILLFKFKDDSNLKVFSISFIGGTILEYIMSFGMELVLGFTAWDYSQKFLNINGRVALFYSICWGILGVIWIKFCYNFINSIIEKMNKEFGIKLMKFLIVFLSLDALFSVSVVHRAREAEKGLPPSNSYEKFLDKTFNQKYLKNMFNNNW